LTLGALLFTFLASVDYIFGEWVRLQPALYLAAMSGLGGVFAAAAFLLLPLPAIQTESARWRELAARRLKFPSRRR
jgi:hypothetical protein